MCQVLANTSAVAQAVRAHARITPLLCVATAAPRATTVSRANVAEDELEDEVVRALDAKGVLASLRAELRLCVAEVLDGNRAHGTGSQHFVDARSNQKLATFQQSGVLTLSSVVRCPGFLLAFHSIKSTAVSVAVLNDLA